ncbi:hypothetical protein ASE49_12370 [Novosphingobium sp. Leaf2]|nr:hypothetical protein ASE49_12370 [Novosphingobium sp. Leaf2]
MQADDEYGAHNKAHNASLMHRFELEGQFGKGWRHHPGASEEVTRMDADLAVAREAHNQAYIAPYWKALRDLVATPSPSIVAATFKSLLITAEEIYNDSAMIADCMTIVAEDFARLAA